MLTPWEVKKKNGADPPRVCGLRGGKCANPLVHYILGATKGNEVYDSSNANGLQWKVEENKKIMVYDRSHRRSFYIKEEKMKKYFYLLRLFLAFSENSGSNNPTVSSKVLETDTIETVTDLQYWKVVFGLIISICSIKYVGSSSFMSLTLFTAQLHQSRKRI